MPSCAALIVLVSCALLGYALGIFVPVAWSWWREAAWPCLSWRLWGRRRFGRWATAYAATVEGEAVLERLRRLPWGGLAAEEAARP